MLKVPQAGILELLGELGCLRKRHIGQFAAAKYGSSTEHVARMLAQLATMGKVQADDDFVMLPGRKPDFDVIRAVDVAMALTGGKMDFAAKGGKSFTLVFSAQGRTFGVAMVGEGMEYIAPMRLRADAKLLTVIFVLNSTEQRKYIQAQENCYFAVQKENGEYQFFK